MPQGAKRTSRIDAIPAATPTRGEHEDGAVVPRGLPSFAERGIELAVADGAVDEREHTRRRQRRADRHVRPALPLDDLRDDASDGEPGGNSAIPVRHQAR